MFKKISERVSENQRRFQESIYGPFLDENENVLEFFHCTEETGFLSQLKAGLFNMTEDCYITLTNKKLIITPMGWTGKPKADQVATMLLNQITDMRYREQKTRKVLGAEMGEGVLHVQYENEKRVFKINRTDALNISKGFKQIQLDF